MALRILVFQAFKILFAECISRGYDQTDGAPEQNKNSTFRFRPLDRATASSSTWTVGVFFASSIFAVSYSGRRNSINFICS